MIKKLWGRIKNKGKKETKKKISKTKKSKAKKDSKSEYENRFQKFYHLNKKRLNKERRTSYKSRSKDGVCVRCSKKVVKDIVFCKYHQAKQKEYNAKARKK